MAGRTIGILAVQGDFAAHARTLERLSAPVRFVRHARELDGLGGIILPGGESTTMLKVLGENGVVDPLTRAIAGGLPAFGTCAGMILLARAVTNPAQASLGLLDIAVTRNGYGRQLDSFVGPVDAPSLSETPIEGVFIRAPVVTALGAAVEVLGTANDRPVLVRSEHVIASSFHPELSDETHTHRAFLDLVEAHRPAAQVSSFEHT